MGFRGSRVQIPPSRLVEEQASHRLRMRGFFFGWAPCCECCCESSRNSAAHNPLLRVQHLLPCGLGDRLLVRPEQRLLVIPSPASTMSRTSSHSFRSPTSSESRARSSIDLLMTRQGDASRHTSSLNCFRSPPLPRRPPAQPL